MSNKPKLLLQKGVFAEDDAADNSSLISQYFDVAAIDETYVFKQKVDLPPHDCFRGSLGLARKLGHRFEFTNALNFAPQFRHLLVAPDTLFIDADSLLGKRDLFPLFVRPVSGFKEFPGNMYTFDAFNEEMLYFKQRNGSAFIICAVSKPVAITKEFRAIYVGNKFSSASQYMDCGELSISPQVPEKVILFAQYIASYKYFQNIFDFVIDIGLVDGEPRLIELNSFECSSFYGADLDKIYFELAATFYDGYFDY